MATTSLAQLWKRFGVVMSKDSITITNIRDKKKFKAGEWFKCLFLDHATSTEVRMERNRHGEKKHYRYCYKCGKKWYLKSLK